MNFYLNQVLQAFSKMDAPQLGELLDPQRTYEDVPMEVFVGKLENIFEDFKKGGDQSLEVLSANCCNLYCDPDKIRSAYRFVGDQTRNYLDFRFLLEITDDLKDYEIQDIYHCYDLRCHEPKDWFGEPMFLRFALDDKADYVYTPDQAIYTEFAMEAMSVLDDFQGAMSFEQLESWLIKFESTYVFIEQEDIKIPPFEHLRWDQFFRAHRVLMRQFRCVDRLKKEGYLNPAHREKDRTEETLIEDIQQIEGLVMDQGCENYFYGYTPKEDFRFFYGDLIFGGEVFNEFSDFWAWLMPLKEKLVKKYYALSVDETEKMLESDEYSLPELTLDLLNFHMDIRAKAKERGEEIPINNIP